MSTNGEGRPGLSWPDHDAGPTPPAEYTDPRDRPTRRPASFWDRTKILVVLAGAWVVMGWSVLASNPDASMPVVLTYSFRAYGWLLALAGLEAIRQVHYLICEQSAGYNQFWERSVFGGFDRWTRRMNDWNRFRVSRALKVMFLLVVIDLVLARLLQLHPAVALLQLPILVFRALPLILQLVFLMFVMVMQFVAIFWFLSKGGVEVYMPEDIKTRFSDVWGQDNVLEKVKENIVFLEDPETIEEKGGFVPGGILLWGPPGTGKGEPVSSKVMTPSGPRPMGSLLPGDHVIGSNGSPTRVLEVHLLGVRDILRVHFSDGTSVRVTEDHLWAVDTMYGGRHVLPVSKLKDRLWESGGKARYRIPMVEPVAFDAAPLPLHPYLLGALLGDGTLRHNAGISSGDAQVIANVEELLPDSDGLVRKNVYDHSIVGGATRIALKELGLLGCYSYEKFIPDEYKWGCITDRLELLRGLLDTDGTIDKRGLMAFHTTSPQLARDVVCLVQSFGGTCSPTTRTTRYTHRGEKRRGRPVTVVTIALPNSIVPFTIARKVERVRPRTKYFPQRRIVGITPDGREEARCIRVDAPDHLYVTENYTVTHNTLLAEAVAGETGKPFMFVEPGAFINMFFGVGILKVKSMFRKLRKLALRYGGVIAFFDEADSLGNRGMAVAGGNWGGPQGASAWSAHPGCNGLSYLSPRAASLVMQSELESDGPGEARGGIRDRMVMGAGMGGGGMGTLQALLTELSGLKKPRGIVNKYVRRILGMKPKPPPKYRILVMMATNMPQALDEAMLRPGRIDRIYKVGYPSKSGRVRTYQGYLSKVRHDLTMEEIDKLATITPYATGASIKDLVNEALINAIRDGRDWITWKDVIKAKLLKELGPPEDVEYIERERHAVAVHEACHAVAAYRVRHHLTIDIATIEKGSSYLGMVASIPLEEQFTQWRSEYEADVMVALSSLAGEKMFFEGDSSSGVTGDLNSATTIAMFMEGYWGMGESIGSHGVFKRVVGQPVADTSRNIMESALGNRIEEKLGDLLQRTIRLLEENRLAVLAVAHALETYKTLTGDDVAAIVEGRRGPLVDGRPYHEPEFLRVAEAYHQRALEAHKGHGKVELALPVFNGQAESPLARRVSGAPDPGGRA